MLIDYGDRPELPLEIVELIVEHIRHDRKTLRAASRVCAVWRTAAFPYLLPDILIAEEADYKRIQKLYERFPRLPTFHVRSITMRPGTRSSSSLSIGDAFRSFARMFEDRRWELNKAASELPVMPKVASLRWVMGREIRHSIVVDPTIHRYLSRLPSLERLTLRARFEDLHELELFLALCGSQLKSITFQGIWFRKNRSRPLTLVGTHHLCDLGSLEKLAFERSRSSDPSYEVVVDLLLLLFKSGVSLRQLKIRYDWTVSPTSLERLLEKAKPTLESLSIEPIGVAENALWAHSCRPFNHIGPGMKSLTVGMAQPTPGGPALTNSAPFEVSDFFRGMHALPPLPNVCTLSIIFRICNSWDASDIWGQSETPERDMRASWHRLLPSLVAQMPSLTLLVLMIKFKVKFDDAAKTQCFNLAQKAVPGLRPGVDVQLQWVADIKADAAESSAV